MSSDNSKLKLLITILYYNIIYECIPEVVGEGGRKISKDSKNSQVHVLNPNIPGHVVHVTL